MIDNTSFRKFNELPCELRSNIWEQSLRPSTPGIHFVSIGLYRYDKPNNEFDEIPEHLRRKYIARPPTFSTEPRFLQEDPSTSLIDNGLWTACNESKRVATQSWLRLRKDSHPSMSLNCDDTNILWDDMEHLGRCVLTYKDLVCLQVNPCQKIDVDHLLPDLIYNPLYTPTANDKVQIAFEFDNSWTFDENTDSIYDMMGQPGPRGCFLSLLERIIGGFMAVDLYLIDSRLSLLADHTAETEFQGGGYKFVEPSVLTVGEFLEYEEDKMTPWGFIAAVKRKVDNLWRCNKKKDGHMGILVVGRT